MPVAPEPAGSDWIHDVLAAIDATPTVGNTMALALWARSEGMPADTFNWLAATDKRTGSTDYNGSGVQEYPSYAVGIDVLHDKFTGHVYPAIGATLRAGDAPAIYEAINSSPWCHGCQNGHYPIALYQWIESGQPGSGGPTPPADHPAAQQTGGAPDSWDHKVTTVGRGFITRGVTLDHTATAIDSLLK